MNQMNDLISRQAAIDVLRGYFDVMFETDTWSPCDVYGLIEVLPSVQPEQSIYEVLTAEEVAKEVSATSLLSCIQWFEVFRRVSEMGYIICRKPE